MNTKELLEKAARAAGYDYRSEYDDNIGQCIIVDGFPVAWQPDEDDGDSARLADVLMITTGHKVMSVYASTQMGERVIELLHDYKNDRAAARRMAVLKLAAMIGEEL